MKMQEEASHGAPTIYCEGIFIHGKLHGIVKIAMMQYSNMTFYLQAIFREGKLDGDCFYIEIGKNTWTEISMVEGKVRIPASEIKL